MDIDPSQLTVTDNETESQFEVTYDGVTAVLQYIRTPTRVLYVHTQVPPELEGHGIAGILAKHGLEDARSRKLPVVPRCPYVAAYIERHPEYADLVEVRA